MGHRRRPLARPSTDSARIRTSDAAGIPPRAERAASVGGVGLRVGLDSSSGRPRIAYSRKVSDAVPPVVKLQRAPPSPTRVSIVCAERSSWRDRWV